MFQADTPRSETQQFSRSEHFYSSTDSTGPLFQPSYLSFDEFEIDCLPLSRISSIELERLKSCVGQVRLKFNCPLIF